MALNTTKFLDEETVRALLPRGAADWIFSRPGCSSVVSLDKMDSFQHEMWKFSLVIESGEGGDVHFVCRVWRGRVCWWVFEADLSGRELAALRLVQGHLPVPAVLADGECGSDHWAVLSFIEGEEDYDQKVPQSEALDLALDMMLQIHATDTSSVHSSAFPFITMEVLLERYHTWCDETGDKDCSTAVRAIQEAWEAVPQRCRVAQGPAFLHCDLHWGNVLCRGHEVVAVLDWEAAAIGDPRFDAAKLAHSMADPEALWVRYGERVGLELGPKEPWLLIIEVRDMLMLAKLRLHASQERAVPNVSWEDWTDEAKGGRKALQKLGVLSPRMSESSDSDDSSSS